MRNDMMEFLNEESAYIGGGHILQGNKHFKGGSSSSALKYQKQQDAEKEAKLDEAMAAIKDIFDTGEREQLYQDQYDSVYNLNANEVARQTEEAERNNRFALARNGLLGGSADVDSNAEIQRRNAEGLEKSAGLASDAEAAYRNEDATARANLVSMANSGTDASTVSNQATQDLATSASNATANSAASSVGDLMGTLSQAYLTNATRAGKTGTTFAPYANRYITTGSTQNTYSGSSK